MVVFPPYMELQAILQVPCTYIVLTVTLHFTFYNEVPEEQMLFILCLVQRWRKTTGREPCKALLHKLINLAGTEWGSRVI